MPGSHAVAEPRAGAEPCRKVFVVGCERSGTTWVRNIFGRHPQVITNQESHLFPTIVAVAAEPPRWRELLATHDAYAEAQRSAGVHKWIDRASLAALVAGAEASEQAVDELADRMVAAVLESYFRSRGGTPAHVLVEKTPAHLLYTERILRSLPEARIVEVVRDGRDVCVSMGHRARQRPHFPSTIEEQATRWAAMVGEGIRRRHTPEAAGRWHVVRFEAMKDRPAEEITQLFAFAGLSAEAEVVARATERTDFGALSADHVGDGKHYRSGRVGDWRHELTDDDLRVYDEIAGTVHSAAGYA